MGKLKVRWLEDDVYQVVEFKTDDEDLDIYSRLCDKIESN